MCPPEPPTYAGPPPRGPDLPPRFRLLARLGVGAFGEVWRAFDAELGREVAVKVVAVSDGDAGRHAREVAALRHVDLPGVVRLLDAGTTPGRAWMAMELVEGQPFPGRTGKVAWAWLAPRLEALLEALAGLHGAGLVHRDLKPNNVLVDAEGRPTILDLGLARGAAIGATITRSNALLGTPRYMSPEQCRGRRVDARADLYAVGVLAFEALTRTVPHAGGDMQELLRLRAAREAPGIRSLVPDLPDAAATCIDALLAVEPGRRPPTAEAALRLLRGTGGRPTVFPFVGREVELGRLTSAVRAGTGARVSGPAGSGRTRLLQEAAARLGSEGWTVRAVPAGQRPYESLLALFPGPEPEEAIRAGVASLATDRVVLVVDGRVEIDHFSRRLLHASVGRAPILLDAGGAATAEVRLGPLPPVALACLFAGPERLFHLRSDAAAVLARRTGGMPGVVVAELDGWVARGVAAWESGVVRVSRTDLERIEGGAFPPVGGEGAGSGDDGLEDLLLWVQLAGPSVSVELLCRARAEPTWAMELQVAALEEVGALRREGDGALVPLAPPRYGEDQSEERVRAIHGALANALPPCSPERVGHLLAAGRVGDAAAEAPQAARALVEVGRVGEAVELLDQAMGGGPQQGDAGLPAELAHALVCAAWADRSVEVVRRARYVAQRAGAEAGVTAVLDANPALSPDVATLTMIAAGPRHPDARVEALRREILLGRVGARRGASWEGELAAAVAWAEETGLPEVQARALGWRADFLYAQARFAESAECAERAARLAPALGERLSLLFRAASVYLEEGEVARVRGLAGEIRRAAAERRLAYHEARAEWLLRSVEQRTGEAAGVDEELVQAAEHLGEARLAGLLLLEEARIAWRVGAAARGQELAARAARRFAEGSLPAAALCARAVAVACGGEEDPRALLADADRLDRPDVSIEVIGLLASAGRLPAGPWGDRIRAAAARLPGYSWSWPHGAVSVERALGWVG